MELKNSVGIENEQLFQPVMWPVTGPGLWTCFVLILLYSNEHLSSQGILINTHFLMY